MIFKFFFFRNLSEKFLRNSGVVDFLMRVTQNFLLTTQSQIVSWSVLGTGLRSTVAAGLGMFLPWIHPRPVLSSATSALIKS